MARKKPRPAALKNRLIRSAAAEGGRIDPTPERLAKGGVVVRENVARAQSPLRIDRLRDGDVIDEMQHLYGLQIITLWTIANRPFLKSIRYERRSAAVFDAHGIALDRMSAEDQFHKVMAFLRPRERELIRRVCFEEMGAIAAGRAIGLPVNSITVYLRSAFDALGDALARMRTLKKSLEEPTQERDEMRAGADA